jgi:hypothetical protein
VFLKSCVDALQHRFQRNARFPPGFDQGPVDGGEQEQRPAAPLKVLFNLGEIVEVILDQACFPAVSLWLCLGFTVRLRS